jgi:hypothetical protein
MEFSWLGVVIGVFAVLMVQAMRMVRHAAESMPGLAEAGDEEDVVSTEMGQPPPPRSQQGGGAPRLVVLIIGDGGGGSDGGGGGGGGGGGAAELDALGAWYRSVAGAGSTVTLALRRLPELDGAGGVRADALVSALRALGAAIEREGSAGGGVFVLAHARGARGAVALAALCHYASARATGRRLFGHWFPRALCAAVLDDAPGASRLTLQLSQGLNLTRGVGAAMDTARALAHARAGQGATLQLAICVWLRAAFLGAAAAPVLRLLDLVLGELLQWWTAGDGDEMDAALARLGWDVDWATCSRVDWGGASGGLRDCLPRHTAQLYAYRTGSDTLVGADGECLAQRVARFASLQAARGAPIARSVKLGAATRAHAPGRPATEAASRAAAGAHFGRWSGQYIAALRMFLADAAGLGRSVRSAELVAPSQEEDGDSASDAGTDEGADTEPHRWGLLPQIWSAFLTRGTNARQRH